MPPRSRNSTLEAIGAVASRYTVPDSVASWDGRTTVVLVVAGFSTVTVTPELNALPVGLKASDTTT